MPVQYANLNLPKHLSSRLNMCTNIGTLGFHALALYSVRFTNKAMILHNKCRLFQTNTSQGSFRGEHLLWLSPLGILF